MTRQADPLEHVLIWADANHNVSAVTLFGSRARVHSANAGPDVYSDIDLHIVSRRPEEFFNQNWIQGCGTRGVVAYAVRNASGGVKKATAVLSDGISVDCVIVPAGRFEFARIAIRMGWHNHWGFLRSSLAEMATVMGYGYKVIKGGAKWQRFYAQVVAEIPGTRLDDIAVRTLADEFLCDFVSAIRKLHRGELIAAQRVLHRSLSEINFQLLHELRLRRGEPSFREARRVERLLKPAELRLISVNAVLTRDQLGQAIDVCGANFRELIRGLVADAWRWPQDLQSPPTPAP